MGIAAPKPEHPQGQAPLAERQSWPAHPRTLCGRTPSPRGYQGANVARHERALCAWTATDAVKTQKNKFAMTRAHGESTRVLRCPPRALWRGERRERRENRENREKKKTREKKRKKKERKKRGKREEKRGKERKREETRGKEREKDRKREKRIEKE